MGHTTTTTEIKNPGSYQFGAGVKMFFILATLVGGALFAFALFSNPERAWPNYLINFFFFMGLAAFGSFFVALQHITNAFWSVTVRRIAEGLMSFIPIALVLAVILYLGREHLFLWTTHSGIEKLDHHSQHLLHGKAPYLNNTFFAIRLIGFLALWALVGFKMRSNSLAQDNNGDHKFTLSNIKLACFYIPLFAVTFSLISFDLLMSLQPTWFSTIFGVYTFAGIMFSGFSLMAILLIKGKRSGLFTDQLVNLNHLHDVGKFMFTFTVFWTYIMFSQLMLMWYANLPEETPYYISRFKGSLTNGWWGVFVFLLVIHFIVPFLALVSRDFKRKPNHLYRMAWLMMFAQWLDVYLMVMPVFHSNGPVFGWIEISGIIAFTGVFGLSISRFLEKVPAIPYKDPRLARCLAHNQ